MLNLRLRLSPIIYFALVWSYLIQPTLWPLGAYPLLKAILLSAAISLLAYRYREISLDVSLDRTDAGVFLAFAAIGGALNFRAIGQSLGCDELYHAERAVFYLHGLKVLPETCPWTATLRAMPIPELNSFVSLVVIASLVAAWGVYRLFARVVGDARYRYLGYFSVCAIVGTSIARLALPAEAHPPLRLLPLFLSQALFGLQDLSFRIPGVLALALCSAVAYRLVRGAQKDGGWRFAFGVGLSLSLIPTVFHVAPLVQPSIWGFGVAFGLFALAYIAQRDQDERALIAGGVLIGLGALMRQNVIFLWPVFFLLCWAYRAFIRHWLLILLPVLFILPYGLTLMKIGHPMAEVQAFERPSEATQSLAAPTPKAISNIVGSVTTGIGPKAIWTSSSPAWVVAALMGMVVVLAMVSGALRWFYLSVILGYGLFSTIHPSLWGVGRYQAEYVAPAMAATVLFLSLRATGMARRLFVIGLAVLGLYSLFFNVTFSQDVHYDHWSRKRLSTESTFPYREALGFLQRQESGGRFVIVGGVPTYGRMILWLRGFSYNETETYWASQNLLNGMKETMTLADFLAFAKRRDLDYFIVQYGDKRERQHRTPALSAFYADLGAHSTATLGSDPGYVRLHTFIGDPEGALDLYGKPSRRY